MTARAHLGHGDQAAIWAVRYCLGRRSYDVEGCSRWLREVWCDLDSYARVIIQRFFDQATFCARRRDVDFPHTPGTGLRALAGLHQAGCARLIAIGDVEAGPLDAVGQPGFLRFGAA